MDQGPTRAGSALREAHLRDYWKIVWQGRWTILAVFAVTVGATGVWTYMQTPIYRATAIVEVQPQARRILAGGDVSGLGALDPLGDGRVVAPGRGRGQEPRDRDRERDATHAPRLSRAARSPAGRVAGCASSTRAG